MLMKGSAWILKRKNFFRRRGNHLTGISCLPYRAILCALAVILAVAGAAVPSARAGAFSER